MGFSSWECKGCGHSLLPLASVNEVNKWMNDAVAVTEEGSIIRGSYSGYAGIGEFRFIPDPDNTDSPRPCYAVDLGGDGDMYDVPVDDRDYATLWHWACWMEAGEPDYSGASNNASDQGYFFDEGEHDVRCPWPNVESKLDSAHKKGKN